MVVSALWYQEGLQVFSIFLVAKTTSSQQSISAILKIRRSAKKDRLFCNNLKLNSTSVINLSSLVLLDYLKDNRTFQPGLWEVITIFISCSPTTNDVHI